VFFFSLFFFFSFFLSFFVLLSFFFPYFFGFFFVGFAVRFFWGLVSFWLSISSWVCWCGMGFFWSFFVLVGFCFFFTVSFFFSLGFFFLGQCFFGFFFFFSCFFFFFFSLFLFFFFFFHGGMDPPPVSSLFFHSPVMFVLPFLLLLFFSFLLFHIYVSDRRNMGARSPLNCLSPKWRFSDPPCSFSFDACWSQTFHVLCLLPRATRFSRFRPLSSPLAFTPHGPQHPIYCQGVFFIFLTLSPPPFQRGFPSPFSSFPRMGEITFPRFLLSMVRGPPRLNRPAGILPPPKKNLQILLWRGSPFVFIIVLLMRPGLAVLPFFFVFSSSFVDFSLFISSSVTRG